MQRYCCVGTAEEDNGSELYCKSLGLLVEKGFLNSQWKELSDYASVNFRHRTNRR
jgi:hypothetical protein